MIVRIYLLISAVIGALEIVDSVLLFKARGICNKWFARFGFVEYVWAGVSVSRATTGLPSWLPYSFAGYVIFGFVYALILQKKLANSKASGGLAVPMWFVVFGGLFGTYFAVSSLFVLRFA